MNWNGGGHCITLTLMRCRGVYYKHGRIYELFIPREVAGFDLVPLEPFTGVDSA